MCARPFLDGLPAREREQVTRGIAVAGTATSAASIDQELDPYDPERVHGYTLLLGTVELLLARLADMTEAERRRAVVGLHPDRAPTIVAGMILLGEAMRAFELEHVEVSEHDILHGGALRLAGVGRPRAESAGGCPQARLDLRGYTTVGSVSTFTSAGLPAENARSSAGRTSCGRSTSSP